MSVSGEVLLESTGLLASSNGMSVNSSQAPRKDEIILRLVLATVSDLIAEGREKKSKGSYEEKRCSEMCVLAPYIEFSWNSLASFWLQGPLMFQRSSREVFFL